jgi:hypothetical protein
LESSETPPVEAYPSADAANRAVGPDVQVQIYTPREFAAAVLEFYQALIDAKVPEDFAQRLAIAFCRRP